MLRGRHLKQLVATFEKWSAATSPPVFETYGVSHNHRIDLGSNTTHLIVECGDQCEMNISFGFCTEHPATNHIFNIKL